MHTIRCSLDKCAERFWESSKKLQPDFGDLPGKHPGRSQTMSETTSTTPELVAQAVHGDDTARRQLLDRYRDQLRRMVAARLDRRLNSRVDASDVVQDTLSDAARQLDEYLRDQPLPFLGWLRQLAAEQIRETHRRHLFSQRRTVARESLENEFSDESAIELGRHFVANGSSPSNQVMRQELRDAVLAAVAELSARDREVLLMRHIEQLGTIEIADALGLTEAGVKARLFRALNRLRVKLEAQAHS
jgi:RNA polymerase sigma-70 factor (ECF subfamily)